MLLIVIMQAHCHLHTVYAKSWFSCVNNAADALEIGQLTSTFVH